MNEQLALRRAIVAEPDNDTPRLVYADWLDENGYAERAAFIRRQIATKDIRIFDATTWSHTALENVGILPINATYLMRKGFIDTVACNMGTWLDNGPKLMENYPITNLRIRDISPVPLGGVFGWFEGGIPRVISDYLIHDSRKMAPFSQLMAEFADRFDAIDALNEAALQWAKEQVKRTPELC